MYAIRSYYDMIPGDADPLNPSGLRLGTPELIRIGMREKEMDEVEWRAGFRLAKWLP